MRFDELLAIVADEPVFETGLLLAGDRDPGDVRRQLSRWVASGRLYRLRRGLYAPAPPYRKVRPHPFLVANHLQRGSYVSLQSALAHYGLIPEHVPVTTSVGPGGPRRWETPIGCFEYRRLAPALISGYHHAEVAAGQQAFVALPEKALLDLVYLVPGADRRPYLRELRLQHLETLDLAALANIAEATGKPKLRRAAARVAALAEAELADYVTL
jgi:hypothetical protein